MRAVLDANVVVSALIWGGAPFGLFEAAAAGQVTLATSPILLAELAAVLDRPHLKGRLRQVRGPVEEALKFYTAFAVCVMPGNVPGVVPDDPDDDHVIAAAIAADARIIASGDRHLLGLGSYQSVRILRPAEALAAVIPAPE